MAGPSEAAKSRRKRSPRPQPGVLLRPFAARVHHARRWAVTRSPSLVGLLYLPVPEDPIVALRPRPAPTPLRPHDPLQLVSGEVSWAGRRLKLELPIPWRDPHLDPGLAALHAGEEALALTRLARRASRREALDLALRLVADWIEHNPVASAPGWEGGYLGRRLACWSAALAESASALEPGIAREWLRSVYLQARYLSANLERHAGGARLLSSLRGLLGAGSILTGTEPRRWVKSATDLLPAEVDAQVLGDGGHASRVPSTHLQVLSDLVDAVELLAPETPGWRRAREPLAAMMRFARLLSHPDGSPAGFSGSHRGSSPEIAGVVPPAPPRPAGLELLTFPESRFTAVRQEDVGDACLIDWVGPDRGAASAGSAASYEASFGGERLVVTPALAAPEDRVRAHNSVCADDCRLRATGDGEARLGSASWGEGPGFAYLRLALHRGRLAHERRMLFLGARAIAVIDRVTGSEARVDSWIHLAAGAEIRERGHRRLYIVKAGVAVTLAWMPGTALEVLAAVSPGAHGEPLATTRLRLRAPGGGPRLIGYVIAEGRRRDAAIDVLEDGEERIGIRFDPRRYLFRWEPPAPPRPLLAD